MARGGDRTAGAGPGLAPAAASPGRPGSRGVARDGARERRGAPVAGRRALATPGRHRRWAAATRWPGPWPGGTAARPAPGRGSPRLPHRPAGPRSAGRRARWFAGAARRARRWTTRPGDAGSAPEVGGSDAVAPPMARGDGRTAGAGPGLAPAAASTGRPPLSGASRALVRGSGAARPSLDDVPWDCRVGTGGGLQRAVALPMARGDDRTAGAGPGLAPAAASPGRPPLSGAARALVRGSGAARPSMDAAPGTPGRHRRLAASRRWPRPWPGGTTATAGAGPGLAPGAASPGRPPLSGASRAMVRGSGAARPSLDDAPWDAGRHRRWAAARGGPAHGQGGRPHGRRRAGARPGCRIDRQAPALRGVARDRFAGAARRARRWTTRPGTRVGTGGGLQRRRWPCPWPGGTTARPAPGRGSPRLPHRPAGPRSAGRRARWFAGAARRARRWTTCPGDSGSAPAVGCIASVASPVARGGDRTAGAGPGFAPDAASTGRPPLAGRRAPWSAGAGRRACLWTKRSGAPGRRRRWSAPTRRWRQSP